MKKRCTDWSIGLLFGCIGMYIFYRPLRDLREVKKEVFRTNEEILKNRQVGYRLLYNQDTVKKRLVTADYQMDSLKDAIHKSTTSIKKEIIKSSK